MKGQESQSVIRYSEAFKQKIVSEIEKGSLTINRVRNKYGITGGATVRGWLKKYGKFHLLRKVVIVKEPGEKDTRDEIKELKAEKQRLESALAQAHLKNLALETLLEIAKDEFGLDLKKNDGLNVSKPSLKNLKGQNKK